MPCGYKQYIKKGKYKNEEKIIITSYGRHYNAKLDRLWA